MRPSIVVLFYLFCCARAALPFSEHIAHGNALVCVVPPKLSTRWSTYATIKNTSAMRVECTGECCAWLGPWFVPTEAHCSRIEAADVALKQHVHNNTAWLCYVREMWVQSLSVQCNATECHVQFDADASVEFLGWTAAMLGALLLLILSGFAMIAVPHIIYRYRCEQQVAMLRKRF